MPEGDDKALERLSQLVQAIGKDPELRQWFVALCSEQSAARRREISRMSQQMQSQQVVPEVIASFNLLADEQIFNAVRVALWECCYIEKETPPKKRSVLDWFKRLWPRRTPSS
ncbi:MAG: hypothetical protein WCO56_26205 [Verrucomicrobiota bacterium]